MTAVALLPLEARAQPARPARPAEAPRDQYVEFDDELLDADLPTPFGDPLISGHVRPPRPQLIRPRTNFVPELYQSIEQI